MKVLFICRSNISRSQMAESFFNKLSEKNTAISAGAQVGQKEGKSIKNYEPVIISMNEVNLDLSAKHTKQVTKEMFDSADVVIAMTDKKHLPDFASGNKLRFWKIIDMKETSLGFHREMRDKIKAKVERLVAELDQTSD